MSSIFQKNLPPSKKILGTPLLYWYSIRENTVKYTVDLNAFESTKIMLEQYFSRKIIVKMVFHNNSALKILCKNI